VPGTPSPVPTLTPHTVPHFKVGKIAKINGWNITMNAEMQQVGAYKDHRAGLYIGVEMKNTSSDGQYVSNSNWQLIDLNGQGYTYDNSCVEGPGSLQTSDAALVYSEDTFVSGLVYCPIPESVHQYQLLFRIQPSPQQWGPDAADAIWDITVTRAVNSHWPPLMMENAGQYLNIPHLQEGDLSNPYIEGKIVTMEKNIVGLNNNTYGFSGSFDVYLLNAICELEGCSDKNAGGPDKLIAKNPTEVGTIIWIDCTESPVGWYSSGGRAYQTTCIVTIIDKAKNLIVGKMSFGPIDPPKGITCADETCAGYGPVPYQDMAKDIVSLPRK